MNKQKWIIAVVTLLILVTTLAGCGEKEKEEALTAAIESMADIKSMTYDMDMDMAMSADGQSMNMKTKANIQYIVDPITMEINMEMDMGDGNAATTAIYAETLDDQVVMYSSMGEDLWYKQTLGDIAALQQYDMAASINMYLSSMNEFKKVGSEEINGVATTKYEGMIPNDSLNEAINASGALAQLNLGEEDAALLESLYSDMGDLPMMIWLEDETNRPIRYEMDMTAMMQKIIDKIMATQEGMKASIDKQVISVTVTGYDNVTSIEIPEVAKNAQDINDAMKELENQTAPEGETTE